MKTGREAESFGNAVDDAAVGLVRDDALDLEMSTSQRRGLLCQRVHGIDGILKFLAVHAQEMEASGDGL